jgi:iron complex outermembrane receptor protein
LSFQTAGRYVKNSIAGNDFTWTAGARYAPVRDLSFRVAFTRAIRSPSVTEAFNPSSSSFIFADDPCDAGNINLGPAPSTRAANCLAAGVTQPFSALSNQRSFGGLTFGNPDLKNEIANSFTTGAVFHPRFISGLTVTVDYVNIRLKQAISAFSPDQVLNACYDSTSFATNPFCALVQRDASGQLSLVKTSYFNSALLQYRGILAGLDYRLSTPFLGTGSHLDFSANVQHLLTLNTSASAGYRPVKSAGSSGSSKNRGVASVAYTNGGFSTQLQGNYIGPANLVPNQRDNQYSVPRVKGVLFTNFAISQAIGKRFTLRGDIDNLFAVKPPYPALLLGAYSTYFPGILGRYYRVGAEVHF